MNVRLTVTPRVALLVFALVVLSAPTARATGVTNYIWTGNSSSNWFDTANWADGTAPDDLSSVAVFGNTYNSYITYSAVHVYGLTFSGNTRPYFLQGAQSTTHIGAGGITYAPAQPVRSTISDNIQLEAGQNWDIQSGTLVIDGQISDYYSNGESSIYGHYGITKTGAGTLLLQSASSNDWSGGLTLSAGRVVINATCNNFSSALGGGTLTFDGGTLVAAAGNKDGDNASIRIENDVVSHGLISTVNEAKLHIGYSGEGYSSITLAADTTVSTKGRALFLDGNIDESGGARKLTVDAPGAVVLTGSNSYTGGTSVTKGVLIFGNAYSIPSYNLDSGSVGHLTAGANGYIGFADSSYTGSVQTVFIDDFDKTATHGTIGFDTDPQQLGTSGAFNNFTSAVNLTGFAADVRLGSATQAILSGSITPQGTNYLFGGGGGLLVVSSQLTGAAAVIVDSPVEAPLTLGLGSLVWNSDTSNFQPVGHPGNSFTGGVTARNSAVIFGPGAMPASGSFTLQDGGYIGNADNDVETGVSASAFLNRFSTATDRGMIGFDYFGDGTATISSPIDLSRFTGGSVYLGTATKAVLGGSITPQGSTYRFGAYKGGELTVESALTDGAGARGVIIGDPASPATFGDYFLQEYSKVRLTGNNSYTGGTTLYGGQLVVGQTNGVVGTDATTALGTGALDVKAFPFPTAVSDTFADGKNPLPQLDADNSGTIVANNVLLETSLQIGSDNSFSLVGVISGIGGLKLQECANLSLGNPATDTATPNTFSGGIKMGYDSSLHVLSDHATGGGAINFPSSSASVYFETTNPFIKGLNQDGSTGSGYLYANAANTAITVDQSFNSVFSGNFDTEYGSLRVVKTGSGTLRLDSGSLYGSGTGEAALEASVSLQVNQGALILGSNYSLANTAPTVWVTGGTLVLASGFHLDNPLVLGSGARLAGSGSLHVATIGSGAILSPGFADSGSIGYLTFQDHLTLAGGGIYEWNIQNPDPQSSGGRDAVEVGSPTTLAITATSADKFTLKAISLDLAGNPGVMVGVVENQLYSWTLVYAQNITGFDPAAFTLDVSQFSTDRGTGLAAGAFSISQDGTELRLNFTAVPEPSTYALLALGLGLVLVAARRRRA